MNRLAFLFSLLLIAGVPLIAQQSAQRVEPATIEGVVLGATTGEPLARAQITLTKDKPAKPPGEDDADSFIVFGPLFDPSADTAASFTTQTDGKFTLGNLEPGAYRMTVARNGYVTSEYGKRSSSGRGTILTLNPGQKMKDVVFRLQQASIVTGRIRDSFGEPVYGKQVSLLKPVYNPNGERGLNSIASASTDDRGEYRLVWVTPGHYYLNVSSSERYMTAGRANYVVDAGTPTFYFPGTFDPSRATVLEVLPGAELSGIDLILPKTELHRVKGKVIDGTTGKPPTNASVSLIPRQAAGGPLYENYAQARISREDGTFEFKKVLPGSYWVRAEMSPDLNGLLPTDAVTNVRTTNDLFNLAFQSRLAAQTEITVVASDLDAVSLTMTPGVRIPLRLTVDGQDLTGVKLDRLRVGLWPSIPRMNAASQQGAFTAEGSGVIENVFPGEYRVWIMEGLRQDLDYYVKEATFDRMDALNGFAQITSSVNSTLNVTLSVKGGRIEGTLVDALSKPIAGAPVVLVPDQSRHRDELYRNVETDKEGKFTMRGIPPGSYKLFAWEEIEGSGWFNPDVVARYENLGKAVRIQESSKEIVEVRIIPATQQ